MNNDPSRCRWAAAGANLFFAVLILALFGGCVGYRLGTMLPPGIETVHVPTFVNESGEPELEGRTTSETVREFQRDGTLRIAGADEADAVLRVTLAGYKLEPLRYRRDRAKTAREYRLTLTADLAIEKTASGKVILEKRVRGESTFEFDGDLSSAKRTALPNAARDLAHDIVESVVEYW